MPFKNTAKSDPTFEDIIAACQPGCSLELRRSLIIQLKNCVPQDDAMKGVIDFLQDHNYDFDTLYDFLNLGDELPTTRQDTSIRRFFSYSILAALLLIAGTSSYLFYQNRPAQKIASSVFYEPGLPVFATLDGDKDFHELMSAYRTLDIGTGLKYYRALIVRNPSNDTLHYFGGWLYFKNKQADSAALSFSKIAAFPGSIYRNKAQYMQAISLYVNGDTKASKLQFEKISQDNRSEYQQDAIRLIANQNLW